MAKQPAIVSAREGRARRIKLASRLEIAIVLASFPVWLLGNAFQQAANIYSIYDTSPDVWQRTQGAFMGSIAESLSYLPNYLFLVIAAIETFQYLLNGQTFLVWALRVVTRRAPFSSSLLEPSAEPAEQATSMGGNEPSPASPNDPVTEDRSPSRFFTDYIERSQRMVAAAQRRPNALLFVGVVVAAIGLGVFIATIPGLFGGATGQAAVNWTTASIELLPKLLMLLFVQVLAGFFLRQYRVSMVELRYYEAVLRYRESQFLSYLVRTQTGMDKAVLSAVGKELLSARDFLNMRSGDTNMFLETQRLEENEFKGLYERIVDLLNTRIPKTQTKSRPKANSKTAPSAA